MLKRLKYHKIDFIIIAAFALVLISANWFSDMRYEQFKEATANNAIIEPYAVETETPVEEIAAFTQTAAEPPKQAYNEITVTATAHCPCAQCCGKTDGITATGTQATAGRTIAADPSVFPYGTELTINGNTYVVEDCGGAIKGYKIDIYFDTHAEAVQFGRRILTARVEV